ncbi:MAG TPA: hypothetical protein VK993_05955 [Chthoniobacterales bacterium]|nr:hypothetical protein [Chthoniobacterales bacterium]
MLASWMHIGSAYAALLLPLLGLVLFRRWYRTSWLAAVALAVSLTGASAAFFLAQRAPAQRLDRLHWDMTREDVVAVAGQSTSTKTYPDGHTRISYGGGIVFCTLDIYFDASGKNTRMFHDH